MSYRLLLVAGFGVLWLIYLYSDVEVRPAQAQATLVQSSEAPASAALQATATTPLMRVKKTALTSLLGYQQNLPDSPMADRKVTLQEAFCRLQVAGVELEDPRLKLVTIVHDQDNLESFMTAFIQTKECNNGTFSRAEISKTNKLLSYQDCRDLSPEDLFLSSGVQNQIIPVLAQTRGVNLGISGVGLFVEKCGEQTRYTRKGSWVMTESGYLEKIESGCRALNRQGQVFQIASAADLNEQGCTSQGECLAVAHPGEGSFKVLDRTNLLATGDDPMKFLIDNARIFTNSQEDFDDPSGGILGPNFDKIPMMEKPAWCPETF